VVLSEGHVDAFGVAVEDGEFFVHIHDEENDVEYLPSQAILQAKPETETTVPAGPNFGFLGTPGSPVWVLPQTETPGVLYAGWASEEIAPGVLLGDVLNWNLISVSGPGSFAVYNTDGFGVPTVIFDSDNSLPQQTTFPAGAHVHGNWAFSAAGTYTINFSATGSLADSTPLDSGPKAFTFVVGPYPPA